MPTPEKLPINPNAKRSAWLTGGALVLNVALTFGLISLTDLDPSAAVAIIIAERVPVLVLVGFAVFFGLRAVKETSVPDPETRGRILAIVSLLVGLLVFASTIQLFAQIIQLFS